MSCWTHIRGCDEEFYCGHSERKPMVEYIVRETAATRKEVIGKLIRCKDCKYWSEYEYINGKLESFPWCELNMTFSKEDDFCSHAERRTDE